MPYDNLLLKKFEYGIYDICRKRNTMNKSSLVFSLIITLPLTLYGETPMNSLAKIVAIQSPAAPKPIGPFSQAIKVSNAQEMLFISGQLPINPITNILENNPAQATEQIMNNIAAILKDAEMTFTNVVKTTILLADINDFAVINKVYESFLTAPYPARATFQVGALPRGARIEIEMIAVK